MILIDIDTDKKLHDVVDDFNFRRRFMEKILDKKFEVVKFYKTKKGYHIYVLSDNAIKMDDVFMQLALGSDWKREILNFSRNGRDNILFSNKYQKENDQWKEISSEEDITHLYWIITILNKNEIERCIRKLIKEVLK
jgi:hypothetical protein